MADDNSDSPLESPAANRRSNSASFFKREGDGTVRLRIRFYPEDAALFEEAAGNTAVIDWIYVTLRNAARQQVQEARERRPQVGPPSNPEDAD